MNEQQLITLLESAEGTIARLMLEVNRLSKEVELRELTDEEIDEVWVETCSDFKLIENGKSKGIINIYDVSRAILKKASEK
jgi:carbonic anhydrase